MIVHPEHSSLAGEAEGVATLIRSLLRELNVGLDDSALNLPLAQFRLCMILSGGPQSMSAIGRELAVSLSAVTQLADRLEKAGFVQRVAKKADRRVRRLQLTERGEKMMQMHHQSRIQRMATVLNQLDPAARHQVRVALEMLVHAAVAAHDGDGHPQEHSPHYHPSGSVV